jgi:hypothetical protein
MFKMLVSIGTETDSPSAADCAASGGSPSRVGRTTGNLARESDFPLGSHGGLEGGAGSRRRLHLGACGREPDTG